MGSFITKSLMAKLVALFLLVSLGPTVIISCLAFFSSKAALEKSTFEKLSSGTEIRKAEINRYIEGAMEDAVLLAHFSASIMALDKFNGPLDKGLSTAEKQIEGVLQDRAKGCTEVTRYFQEFLDHWGNDARGYDDILIISGSSGDVLCSARAKKDLPINLTRGPLKDTSLARLFSKIMQTSKPAMVDYSSYPPNQIPVAFLGAPIKDSQGIIQGVLALAIDSRTINTVMRSTGDMGRSTVFYLVGPDFLMRSQLPSESSSTILKTKMEFKAVAAALKNESGTAIMPDEKGEISLFSYSYVGLRENRALGADFDWAIIADAETGQVLSSVTELGWRMFFMGISLVILSAAIGIVAARGIARPISELSDQVARVSEGDLTVDVLTVQRQDEVGQLLNSFHSMVNSIRDQTSRILEGVTVLASASTQISATISQLASSGSATSSAVSETTAALEQLRQTGRLSSDKAKSSAEDSRKSFQIALEGKKATEDSIEGMGLIRQQMESIGDTVIRLSEQSRSIEEIIATVKDLAEQSNMLAVNAAIEAARAGEQGKGFAVVAEEIKSLSDQSKRATDQVRTILEDIRNSISGVVMATERGSNAVDAGTSQSSQAGKSIEAVTRSVHEASQALNVIVASSEQQSVGVDQVALAMDNIDRAMQQNVEGTRQLQASARDLEALGKTLKDLVERYKI